MKIVKEFILREIAEEYILIPAGATSQEFNGVITLTESAVFIFNHIEEVDSFDELIELMKKEYDVDKETLINDATAFIVELISRGIVKPDHPQKGW